MHHDDITSAIAAHCAIDQTMTTASPFFRGGFDETRLAGREQTVQCTDMANIKGGTDVNN